MQASINSGSLNSCSEKSTNSCTFLKKTICCQHPRKSMNIRLKGKYTHYKRRIVVPKIAGQCAEIFYSNSVRPSTKKTYITGQKRWFAVAELIDTDPLMRMIPKEWEIRRDPFKLSTLTWHQSCMLAILASCSDPKKAVIPSTAFAYLKIQN